MGPCEMGVDVNLRILRVIESSQIQYHGTPL